MKHINAKLLREASAYIRHDEDYRSTDVTYMCWAVQDATGNLKEGCEAEDEFVEVLIEHGVSVIGSLSYEKPNGEWVGFFDGLNLLPDRQGFNFMQEVRFMFLNLLADAWKDLK